ncbi:MAG: ribonuclease P [Candidatus Thorarchaeota archaeon]|nr:ribonuclease P [Candidatus Thorarchaeota archaeon]MCK5240386.1 ribonuclease P [Candidatus Thorarchaeota archaeon]
MARRRAPKKQVRKLAQGRIDRLWTQSRDEAATRPERARAWMSSAGQIAQKARMKLPNEISRQICKSCGIVFVPGRNCRMRVRNNRSKHVSVTCLNCGTIRRFPVIRQS